MRVSVIATVKNEGKAIRDLLDSLAAQTRPPDEVVIVDGGSQDDTVAQIQAYEGRLPLRVLVEPGANISRGRNLAIAAATGEVIASTDAGVRLAPDWLERLVEPFADPAVQVVSGFFVPDPRTVFEVAMGATVLPEAGEVRPASFLPSSRSVAFRKAAWEAAGGYPEWLDFCEDLIFDFRLRALYGPFPFVPEAVVHFRPRSSLRAFFRQYWQYARGDGKANLWWRRHCIRYATYLVVGPALVALGLLHHRRGGFCSRLGLGPTCGRPTAACGRCSEAGPCGRRCRPWSGCRSSAWWGTWPRWAATRWASCGGGGTGTGRRYTGGGGWGRSRGIHDLGLERPCRKVRSFLTKTPASDIMASC